MHSLNFEPKTPPLNSEFGPEIGVQNCNCASTEKVLIKTYAFYTLNTMLFSRQYPRAIGKMCKEFLLSWDLRFECTF